MNKKRANVILERIYGIVIKTYSGGVPKEVDDFFDYLRLKIKNGRRN